MGEKTFREGQALRMVSSFAVDTKWGDLDPRDLQKFLELPASVRGQRFTQFLWSQFSQHDPEPICGKRLLINRGLSNPIDFLGEGWEIVGEETDNVSKTITRLDLSHVQLVTMLNHDETFLNGEERLKRLKSLRLIRLDLDIFHTLLENQHLIPESWKKKVNGNHRFIYFEGTILQNLNGNRYALCLYWGRGRWCRQVVSLDGFLTGDCNLSAVLVP